MRRGGDASVNGMKRTDSGARWLRRSCDGSERLKLMLERYEEADQDRERERESEREKHRERRQDIMCMYVWWSYTPFTYTPFSLHTRVLLIRLLLFPLSSFLPRA